MRAGDFGARGRIDAGSEMASVGEAACQRGSAHPRTATHTFRSRDAPRLNDVPQLNNRNFPASSCTAGASLRCPGGMPAGTVLDMPVRPDGEGGSRASQMIASTLMPSFPGPRKAAPGR